MGKQWNMRGGMIESPITNYVHTLLLLKAGFPSMYVVLKLNKSASN